MEYKFKLKFGLKVVRKV